jgi:hypothetical protein
VPQSGEVQPPVPQSGELESPAPQSGEAKTDTDRPQSGTSDNPQSGDDVMANVLLAVQEAQPDTTPAAPVSTTPVPPPEDDDSSNQTPEKPYTPLPFNALQTRFAEG